MPTQFVVNERVPADHRPATSAATDSQPPQPHPRRQFLEQALAASAEADSVSELEGKLALLRDELAQTRARLGEAELRLQAASEREQLSARLYRALAERARHELAACPRCRKPLCGSDLLVSGHCPNADCRTALTSLLTPTPKAGAPDKDGYFALLGALGALVGLALAASEQGTG
jgi:uncharacterized small protein (DUF1192 family)